MDPWLESPAVFPDLHNSLLTYLGDVLNASLPEPYIARSGTRVWVEDERRREPDIGVFDPLGRSPDGGNDTATALAGAGLIAVAAPPIPDPLEEPYLEIRSTADERLVTVVEVLSPANKTVGGTNHGAYRQKQTELRSANVGLVELDLLRGGVHTTAVPIAVLRARGGQFDYHLCVSAAGLGDQLFIAPIRLEDRLPRLGVPLDPGMPPVVIELQPLLDRCYDNRRYARQVRYDRPPDPPLNPDQQAWAEGVLREKGVLT
jgi:hypothetical protein